MKKFILALAVLSTNFAYAETFNESKTYQKTATPQEAQKKCDAMKMPEQGFGIKRVCWVAHGWTWDQNEGEWVKIKK